MIVFSLMIVTCVCNASAYKYYFKLPESSNWRDVLFHYKKDVIGKGLQKYLTHQKHHYSNGALDGFSKFEFFKYKEQLIKIYPNLGDNKSTNEHVIDFLYGFVQSVTPREFDFDEKMINVGIISWLYIYDDIITEYQNLSSTSESDIENVNKHCLDSWKAGLEGNEYKEYKTEKTSLNKIGNLAYALYYSASLLNRIATRYNANVLDVSFPITSEVAKYLNSLLEQYNNAPETPQDYLDRHEKSGGAAICLMLNASINLLKNKVTRFNLEKYKSLFQSANITILKTNDAMVGKDIGKAEELYFSLLLYENAQKNGVNVDNYDMTQSKYHGKILEDLGPTEIGYETMLQLAKEIDESFNQSLSACESFENSDEDKIVFQSVFCWIFGYYLYNPISLRYSGSFKLYFTALTGDFADYKREFLQLSLSVP